MLRSVHGEVPALKRWCGPSAITIITGQPYHHALALLKDAKKASRSSRLTREPVIKGTSSATVRSVLLDLGYRTSRRNTPAGQTVAAWLAARQGADHFATFLIAAANHWMVVEGEEACCGILGDPKPVTEMKFRRGVLTECWVVEPLPGRLKPIVTTPRAKPRKVLGAWERGEARDRRAFVKLAKTHGLAYEIVRDCATIRYLEIAPCARFPLGLHTMHHDWAESLDRLQHCLAHPEDAASGGYGR